MSRTVNYNWFGGKIKLISVYPKISIVEFKCRLLDFVRELQEFKNLGLPQNIALLKIFAPSKNHPSRKLPFFYLSRSFRRLQDVLINRFSAAVGIERLVKKVLKLSSIFQCSCSNFLTVGRFGYRTQ
jgi:hypothetical protein